MAIEELTATLEREAKIREESLLRDAEREAETLLEAARSSVALLNERENALRRERERLAMRRHKSDAVMKKRLRQAHETQKLAERLREMTRELFRAFMRSDRYPDWIVAAMERGAVGLGENYSVVADVLSAAALKKRTSRPVSIDEDIEGFVILAEGGKVRIDATVGKWLAKVWRLNAASFADELEALLHDQP